MHSGSPPHPQYAFLFHSTRPSMLAGRLADEASWGGIEALVEAIKKYEYFVDSKIHKVKFRPRTHQYPFDSRGLYSNNIMINDAHHHTLPRTPRRASGPKATTFAAGLT